MQVYGKRRRKYTLPNNPISQDYDGAVYSVVDNSDILIKIYRKEHCTAEKEKEVIDTVNGVCSMLGEMPIDAVYRNGRFAGYIYENEQREHISFEDLAPEPAPVKKPAMGSVPTILGVLGIGLALSLLTYFLIFGLLANLVNDTCAFWNFNGIPMILGGCGLMLFAFLNFSDRGGLTLLLAAGAYLLGSAVTFGLVCLLVAAITFTASLLYTLLPYIVAGVVIFFVVKMFIRR